MMVSERGFRPSFLSPCRRSDPAIMIVCGLPLLIGVSSRPVPPCSGMNLSTVSSRTSSAVAVVAHADTTTITSAPMSDFLSNAQAPLFVAEAVRGQPHKVDQGTAIGLQGGD